MPSHSYLSKNRLLMKKTLTVVCFLTIIGSLPGMAQRFENRENLYAQALDTCLTLLNMAERECYIAVDTTGFQGSAFPLTWTHSVRNTNSVFYIFGRLKDSPKKLRRDVLLGKKRTILYLKIKQEGTSIMITLSRGTLAFRRGHFSVGFADWAVANYEYISGSWQLGTCRYGGI